MTEQRTLTIEEQTELARRNIARLKAQANEPKPPPRQATSRHARRQAQSQPDIQSNVGAYARRLRVVRQTAELVRFNREARDMTVYRKFTKPVITELTITGVSAQRFDILDRVARALPEDQLENLGSCISVLQEQKVNRPDDAAVMAWQIRGDDV